MYVPQHVLASGSTEVNGASAKALKQVRVRVELLALEGRAAEAFRGSELSCEVRCGSLQQPVGSVGSKLEGPKRSFAVRVEPASNEPSPRLALAPGTAPLVFDLPNAGALGRGELRCRVKLWENRDHGSPRMLGVGRQGRLLGDLCFSVPNRAASGSRALGDGHAGLALRVDARWDNLGSAVVICLADQLGQHVLNAATQQRWPSVTHLARLVSTGGWGQEAPQDSIRALVVSKVDSEGRTPLRLCVRNVVPGEIGGPMAAAKALLEGLADPHSVAADGASPLTAAIQVGQQFAPLLVHYAAQGQPSISRAVGLSTSPPWMQGPVDWEVLRNSRAFDLILWHAERMAVANPTNPWASSLQSSWQSASQSRDAARLGALSDMLCHAVSRRFLAMTNRVLAVMPPLNGRASLAEALLLEQMLRLASADARWFSVAQAQLRRGAAVGTQVWRGGHRVLCTLADLAAQGQPHAQEMLLEAALGKEWASSCDEPRVLFPELAAECSVCFEPLYQNDPTFFINDSKRRSCVHYVCGACAVTCLPSKVCPMCRAPIRECKALPPLEVDPRAWFREAGCEAGRLDPAELCHAVAACLPVSEERLLRAIEDEDGPWKRYWDRNADGFITEDEFFAPDNGLFSWILAHLQELHRAERRSTAFLPDLRKDPAAWFDFWADRGTGSLTFGEVLRGVFGSRRLSALEDRKQLHNVRNEVAELWRNAGVKADSVTKAEFLRPGGLGVLLGGSLERAGVPVGQVSIAKLPPSPQLRSRSITEDSSMEPPMFSLPSANSANSGSSPTSSRRATGNPFLPQQGGAGHGPGNHADRPARSPMHSSRQLSFETLGEPRTPKRSSRQLGRGDMTPGGRSPKPPDASPSGRSPKPSARQIGVNEASSGGRSPKPGSRQTPSRSPVGSFRQMATSPSASPGPGAGRTVLCGAFSVPPASPMPRNRDGAQGGEATAAAIARATSAASIRTSNHALETILAMGFSRDGASSALEQTGGDVERAVGILLGTSSHDDRRTGRPQTTRR